MAEGQRLLSGDSWLSEAFFSYLCVRLCIRENERVTKRRSASLGLRDGLRVQLGALPSGSWLAELSGRSG